MSRQPADNRLFTLRRISPVSSHWRKPPNERLNSGAFSDRLGELSVDLWNSVDRDAVLPFYKTHIDKKYGLAYCQVEKIRERFQEKEIDGDILTDPIPENERHGIITGKPTNKKKKQLSGIFQVLIKPGSFSN